MALISGSFNLGSTFNIGTALPVDSRMRVEYKNDLTSVWDNSTPAYQGMVVTVMYSGTSGDTPLGEVYVLKGSDATQESNWEKLVSGDGLVWNDFSTTTTTEQGGETTT